MENPQEQGLEEEFHQNGMANGTNGESCNGLASPTDHHPGAYARQPKWRQKSTYCFCGSGGKRIRCYCGYGTSFMSSMRAHVAFKHLQRPLVLCPHCPHFSKYSVLDMKKHIGSQHPWSNQDPIDKRDEAADELEELLKLCIQNAETKPNSENGAGGESSSQTNGQEDESPSRKKMKSVPHATCVHGFETACACPLCGVRGLGMETYNKLILHEHSLVFCPLCPIPNNTAPVKQLTPLHIPSIPYSFATPTSCILPPVEEPSKDMQVLSNLSLPPSPEPLPPIPQADSPGLSAGGMGGYRNPLTIGLVGSPPLSPNGDYNRRFSDSSLRTSMCSICHEPVKQDAAHQHAIRHLGRNLIRCPLCSYTLRTSVTSMRAHIATDHPGFNVEPINDRPAALEEIREIKKICFGTDDLNFPIDYSIKSLLSPPPPFDNHNHHSQAQSNGGGSSSGSSTPVFGASSSTRYGGGGGGGGSRNGGSTNSSRTRKMTPRDPNYTSLYDTERCCLCDEDVRIPEAAHQHAIRHLGKNLIRCPLCSYSLRISVISMRSHIATEHPDSDAEPINDRAVYINEIRDLKKQCFPKRYGSTNGAGGESP